MAVEFFALETRHEMTKHLHSASSLYRWTEYLVVASIEEAAVRSAIAALGYTHLGTGRAVHTSLQRPIDTHKWVHAVDMYSKAHVDLNDLLNRAHDQTWLIEPVLACCAVLFILELHCGNHAGALRHCRFGRRIMAKHLGGKTPMLGSTLQYICDGLNIAGSDELSRNPRCFGRYTCIEAAEAYFAPKAEHDIKAANLISCTSRPDVGERIEILISAGNALQTTLLDIAARRLEKSLINMASLSDARRYCLVRCFSRSVPLDDHPGIERRLDELLKAHDSWRVEAHAFLHDKLSPVYIQLQLRFFISGFNLGTCRTTDERELDMYHEYFVSALNLVGMYFTERRLAAITLESAAPYVDRSSNAGMFNQSVISTLLIVASKCRDSAIRRRAVGMLRHCRRKEGIGTTQRLELLTDTAVELEEQATAEFWGQCHAQIDLVPSWTAEQVPEEARFSDVVLSLGRDGDEEQLVVCAYSTRHADGSIRLLEHRRGADRSRTNEIKYHV